MFRDFSNPNSFSFSFTTSAISQPHSDVKETEQLFISCSNLSCVTDGNVEKNQWLWTSYSMSIFTLACNTNSIRTCPYFIAMTFLHHWEFFNVALSDGMTLTVLLLWRLTQGWTWQKGLPVDWNSLQILYYALFLAKWGCNLGSGWCIYC